MYIFKDISKEELDRFNYSSPNGHLFQSSNWANVKSNWISKYIGGYDKNTNKIELSSLILIRKMPLLPRYIAYIPRGITCDYSNKPLLSQFFKYLKLFMKRYKIAFITLDPDINYKMNGSIDEQGSNLIDFFSSQKIKINPSTNFDSIQPGTVFRLSLPTGSKDSIKDDIFRNFSTTTKRNIKTAMSRGLSIERYTASNISQEKLTSFYELMNITGKRDNFIIRERNYFNILLNKLHPNISMYLVSYDYKKDYDYLNNKLTNLRKERDRLVNKYNDQEAEVIKHTDKLKKSITDLDRQVEEAKNNLHSIHEYKDKKIYLSGSIYAHYGKKAWYLYGASHDILRNTMPNYLMQWEMIKQSIDLGCTLYDFRGTPKPKDGENLPGLFKFKKGFNGDFIEFIGEIYLVKSRVLYYFYKTTFPKFKELRVRLKNNL